MRMVIDLPHKELGRFVTLYKLSDDKALNDKLEAQVKVDEALKIAKYLSTDLQGVQTIDIDILCICCNLGLFTEILERIAVSFDTWDASFKDDLNEACTIWLTILRRIKTERKVMYSFYQSILMPSDLRLDTFDVSADVPLENIASFDRTTRAWNYNYETGKFEYAGN